MSLPASDPFEPDDTRPLSPARRRRQRRTLIPDDKGERAVFLQEFSRRATVSLDFFLFSLLAGLTLTVALLSDSTALFVLAALVSPFMAPLIGLSSGIVAGSGLFFLQSLGTLAIGSLLPFLGGLLAGWLTRFWPAQAGQAALRASLTLPDLVVLTLGAGLTTYLMVRSQKQRPLSSSVAIAYELYLPLGVAGFGLAAQLPGLWPEALKVFALHLAWAAVVCVVMLVILGLRPLNVFAYVLGGVLLAALVVATLWYGSGLAQLPRLSLPAMPAAPTTSTPMPSVALVATVTPSPAGATRTPTNTLVPTRTPTLTVSPAPTPIWAKIVAGASGGAFVRAEPNYQALVVKSLLNDMLVEVLPETEQTNNSTWVRVRTTDGIEGWIVRSLLVTATPATDG
jgi:hypothetical protein